MLALEAFPLLLLIEYIPFCLLSKHPFRIDPASELGAQQECPRELAMQRITLVGWWCEAVAEHHGNRVADARRHGLHTKVINRWAVETEGLAKGHDRVDVGVAHELFVGRGGRRYKY